MAKLKMKKAYIYYIIVFFKSKVATNCSHLITKYDKLWLRSFHSLRTFLFIEEGTFYISL